jgi:hypothetical protein
MDARHHIHIRQFEFLQGGGPQREMPQTSVVPAAAVKANSGTVLPAGRA